MDDRKQRILRIFVKQYILLQAKKLSTNEFCFMREFNLKKFARKYFIVWKMHFNNKKDIQGSNAVYVFFIQYSTVSSYTIHIYCDIHKYELILWPIFLTSAFVSASPVFSNFNSKVLSSHQMTTIQLQYYSIVFFNKKIIKITANCRRCTALSS